MKQFLLLLAVAALLPLGTQAQKSKKVKPDAIIVTDFGEIHIKLYEETPEHRNNFLKLAKEGLYNGTTFHRVMNEFMIQGGDPNSKDPAKKDMAGRGGPGYTLPGNLNTGFIHKKGALAAARQPDQVNPQRRSSGSQFYIVHGRTFTDKEIDRFEQQIKMVMGQDFAYTPEQREAYKNMGGAPWLDKQYTIFGEVISGLDVVDKIAQVEVGRANKPVKDVTMEVIAKAKVKKAKKKKKKKAKKKKEKK